VRPRNSRRLIRIADALFGLALVVAAFAGPIRGLLSGAPSPAPGAAAPPDLVKRFGGLAPPGQTTGFAVAPDGGLGIVDRGRNVVLHLTSDGRPIAEWGPRFGSGLDAQDLLGLAADGDGWYVLDRGALRIVRLDSTGQVEPRRTIDLQPLATYGPSGLAVDGRGNLYLADTGRDRILVFDPSGRPPNTIGEGGADLGKLKQPMGLAFGPDDAMYVADWENGRIERFDASGQATNAWPLPVHAWGVAVDRQGRVYAPDMDRKLVRVFGPDGQLLFQIGGETPGPLPVESPSQVAVARDGASLWVLGSDALARADLRPYAGVRASDLAEPVRWPLALAGLALVAVAACAPAVRRMGTSTPAGRSRVSNAVALTPPGATWRAPAPLLLPTRYALAVGAGAFALGGLGALLAAVRLTDPLAPADPWPRLSLLVLSSLVWAIGCALTVPSAKLRWIADWPTFGESVRRPARSRRRAPLVGVLGAAVLSVIAAAIWWSQRFRTPDATRGAMLWLVAIAIAAVTCASVCTWRLPRLSLWTLLPWLLYLLALAPRIWNVADLPYGLWFDEAQAGLEARRLLAEGRFTPITDTYGRDASLFYYLISAASLVVADPISAGRGVAALVGAANAPLLYLLGRELFGWRVGLAAGVLVATDRWHLDVSRLGWDPISLPVCATLAFWLLARGVRRERWTDLVWAGMAFGLGLHGYIGFRGMPLVAVVLLVYAAWLRHWPVRRSAMTMGILVGACVLAALPVLVFAVQDPGAFNGRLDQTLILNQPTGQAQKLAELWSNVQKHALMFHVRGDMNGRHNVPGWPMLDPLSGVLSMLGLAWLVIHLLDWRAWLVFGWSAVAMSGGILTLPFEAPQAMRTLAMTPVLALLGALGLVLLIDRLAAVRAREPLVARAFGAVAAISVVWIGVLNVSTFFGRQMLDPTVWASFSTRETIPARAALASLGRFEMILGSPTIAPSVESDLLVPGLRDRIRAFDATADLPYRGDGPVLIVLETEHDAALAAEVARYYPDAARVETSAPNGVRPLVEQFTLERDVLAARRGVDATYQGADGSTVRRLEYGADLSARDVPVATPAQVIWRGGLALDVSGSYAFEVPSDFALDVDGAPLSTSGSVDLARGNHVFELRGTLAAGQPLRLAWRPPAVNDAQAIEPRVLYVPPEGGNGLAATFFPTLSWEGRPREQVIDPIVSHYFHVNPFSRLNVDPHGNWSVEWRGLLEVPAAGTYRFEAERISRAGLWIDERVVFDDTANDAPEQTSGVAELASGQHQIRVRLQDRAEGGPGIYLFWVPPGGARQVIPGRALFPPLPTPQGP
jgi:Dolichyl-phosphate-mannose-protein mannosyltransferase/PA14 domain